MRRRKLIAVLFFVLVCLSLGVGVLFKSKDDAAPSKFIAQLDNRVSLKFRVHILNAMNDDVPPLDGVWVFENKIRNSVVAFRVSGDELLLQVFQRNGDEVKTLYKESGAINQFGRVLDLSSINGVSGIFSGGVVLYEKLSSNEISVRADGELPLLFKKKLLN